MHQYIELLTHRVADTAARPQPSSSCLLMHLTGEAGSVWRRHKSVDFESKLRVLGMRDNPEARALFAELQAATSAVEVIWKEQQQPGYQAKWWADGEYDEGEADRHARTN